MYRVNVYLSPSVQDWNIGYGTYGTEEQRMNMVADVVEYELNRHGITTARNRPEMTLQQVVAESNSIGPNVHLAIHSNASVNGSARGVETYVHRFGGAAEQFGRDIHKYLVPLVPGGDLGVKESYSLFNGQGMYENRYTVAPATLVEVSFHDNPQDAQFIIDNIYEIGREMSKGVLEYFGVPYREDSAENIALMKYKYNGVYL